MTVLLTAATGFAVALVPNNGLPVSNMVAQNRAAVVQRKISRSSEATMQLPRVVVTGMGIVSPLGATVDEVKDKLYNCDPGITYCQEFADVGMKSQVSGMPTFNWCVSAMNRCRRRLTSKAFAFFFLPAVAG